MTVSAPPRARTFAASMPPRSITTAATSRVTRTREPFAPIPMRSPMFEPLKSRVSLPASPSTVSLPSPGSHWKWSSPVPRRRGVGADVAVDEVVAGAADQHLGAVVAEQRVVAGAAVHGERHRVHGVEDADLVVAGARVHGDRS